MRATARRLIAALAGVATAVPAAAQQGYRWEHPMMGWGGPFTGMLMMVVFVAVVVVAVLVVRYLWNIGHGHGGPEKGPSRREDALAILDKRYARGEIDREDYLQRKADLAGTPDV
jgi:putative membrane protein